MKTIKILTIILVTIIVGTLIWALILPSELHIKKTIMIKAPMGVVFNEVNDLHNWNNWSAWKDTTLSSKYEGSEKGVGASVIWTDKKEGEATLSIIKSIKFSSITTEMTVPDKSDQAQMRFDFEKIGDSIEVSWSRDVVGLSYPFGRFVGWMLEKGYEHNFINGLQGMKYFIETNKSTPEYYGYEPAIYNFPGGKYMATNTSCTMAEMEETMSQKFGGIMKLIAENNISVVGAPVVQWHSYNPEGNSKFTCMVPVQTDSTITAKEVFINTIPALKTIIIKYTGPYEGSYNAWMALDNYVVWNTLEMNGDPWEEYITDPATEPDSTKWITNIYFPVK